MIGVVAPSKTLTISSRTDGIVDRVLVENGDLVARGDAVLQLDQFTMGNEIQQARAKRAAAAAVLDARKTQRAQARAASTKDDELGSQLVSDEVRAESKAAAQQAEANVRAAGAQVAAAEAELAMVRSRQSELEVEASSPGRVEEILVLEGEFVNAGQPVARLRQDEAPIIRFAVVHQQLAEVHPGAIVCVLPVQAGQPAQAVVADVDAELDVRTGFAAAQAYWPAGSAAPVIGSALSVTAGACPERPSSP